MKLNHIGYACKNIPDSVAHIKAVYEVEEISPCIFDEEQQVSLCYITLKDSTAIELVSGETINSYVKNGISLYHVCYECEDIYKSIEIFKNSGAYIIRNPVSAKLFEGRLVAFMQTELGLIELLETEKRFGHPGLDGMESKSQTTAANIILAGNFTVDPLKKYLDYYNKELKANYDIVLAPYNQIFQQLLSRDSLLSENELGYNIILISMAEWFHYSGHELADYEEKLKNTAKEFVTALINNLKFCTSQYIIVMAPSGTGVDEASPASELCNKVENNTRIALEEAHISCITSTEILSLLGTAEYGSAYSNKIAHIPYVEKVYAIIGAMIMRKLLSMEGYQYKVIVTDCDNTLWEGNCADVEDGEVKITEGKKYLQKFLLNQMKSGMLLCICSKNNEKDVMEVFETNPNMILKKEHITAFRVNWLNKSDNIQYLADKLNLGIESFIFLDDSPYECEEVSQAFPEVLSLRIPVNDHDIISFLNDLWVFDKYHVVNDSGARTQYYKENFLREEECQKAVTFEQFIEELCINILISPIMEDEIERVSELSKRTNQFNLSQKRRSENEIRELLNKGYQCDVVNVSDRFGSYGLVGVIIYKSEDTHLRVDTFLLSCRALGRGVENEMMIHIGKKAEQNRKKEIVFEYKINKKNEHAYQFVKKIGETVRSVNQEHKEIVILTDKACAYKFMYKENKKGLVRRKDVNISHNFQRGKVLQKLSDIDRVMDAVLGKADNSSGTLKLAVDISQGGVDNYVIEFYKEVLNLDEINMEDGFTLLGGDSIKAVRIVSGIFSKYDVELPLQAIFDCNVGDIIELIKRKLTMQNGTASDKAIPDTTFKNIVRQVRSEWKQRYPLSLCQQALMQHELIDTETFVYNMPWILEIKGELQTEGLYYAFQRIIEKHEAFRTIFNVEDGVMYQDVKDDMEFAFEELYLKQEEEIRFIIRQEETKKFDISKGPLLRAVLIHTNVNEFLMIITIHHIIFDGWSYSLLFKDLSQFYQDYVTGNRQPVKKSLAVRYADYVIWEREYSKTESMKKKIGYWKKKLKGLQLHKIPVVKHPSVQETYDGLYLPIEFNQNAVKKLRNICISSSATLYTGMLCIFDLFLYQLTESPDVAVGTVVAMRNAKELEEIIGAFINTIVIRSDIKEEESFRKFLKNNRKVVIEGFLNKDAYFGDVILASEESIPEGEDNPFYQAMYLFQNTPKESFLAEGLQIRKYREGYNIARADLILELEEKEDILLGGFYFNTSYFIKEVIQIYAAKLNEILVNCTKEPDTKIKDILSGKDII